MILAVALHKLAIVLQILAFILHKIAVILQNQAIIMHKEINWVLVAILLLREVEVWYAVLIGPYLGTISQ